MASESDRVAFDESVQPFDETVLFQDKKWTYITDSTSNGGNFSSQIQFDLNTLSSQSQWVDLSQAYVQFPIRVKVRNAGASSISSVSTTQILTCLKNGFHQFIDSVQLVVDGQTIQTSQIYENIAANFRVLSTWSKDTLAQYGPTLGIALDNYDTIENTATATLIPATWGIDMIDQSNTGISARQSFQNTLASSGANSSILGAQAKNLGKSQVAVVSTATVASNAHCYTQFVLATVRLADLSPAIKAMPMTRNLKGFLYLNYNSSTTTVSFDATPTLTGVSTVSQFGRCAPVLLNNNQISQLSKASATWELEATISGVQTDLTSAAPPLTYARLVCPYYVANPMVDSALSMKKTFRYLERNVSTFDITAGANITTTLSPGIANPKGILLFPYFTGSSTVSNLLSNPLLSVADTCPSTTSPFAALKDLQLLVANKPIFNNPVSYDSDLFLQEIAQLGADGGLNNEFDSGLISAQDWDRYYRYYYVNVGRRLESEDGSSKSVIVQCTNATTCNMRVIAMIFYEKEITVDTSAGRVYQGRA
jgi:hypothetical protein